jgi:hypothetical protein
MDVIVRLRIIATSSQAHAVQDNEISAPKLIEIILMASTP